MDGVRRFSSTAWITYRTLFHWLHPASYVASKVVGPCFQILALAMLARYSGGPAAMNFAIVGNAASLVTLNGIYGVTRSIQTERLLGTLPYVLGSPGHHAPAFLARGLMHWADGWLNGSIALVVAMAMGGPMIPRQDWLQAAIGLMVAGWSATGLGFCLGSLTLVVREWAFFLTNLAYAGLLAFAGVNFPVDRLPGPLRVLSWGLPLTRSLLVIRGRLTAGSAWTALATEALLGAAYIGVGYGVIRLLEQRAQKTGIWAWQ
jgi:ABC-2 type transport system permease protein